MQPIRSPRFEALDSFRGLAIATMILVNTPGNWTHVYPALTHAQWHGFTLADLVFPMFLFAVGASLYFSSQAKQATSTNKSSYLRVIQRALLMFAIGWFLNFYNFLMLDLEHARTMGVLQRIAICYLFAGLMIAAGWSRAIGGIGVMLLVLYGLLFSVGGDPYAQSNNLVLALDRAVLGDAAMWTSNGVAFDPEGLLSSLPATVSLLIGFEVTRRWVTLTQHRRTLRPLLLWGVVMLLLGLLVSLIIPVNKNLWTPSFVLVTGGLSILLLTALAWSIDEKSWRWLATPLKIFGVNPLFIYCLSWLLTATMSSVQVGEQPLDIWLWQCFVPLLTPKLASLFYASVQVMLFWLVSLWLYRRDIVIKI